jgi:FlaA1/EpsC-like NDP-sugar epimerase
MLRVFMQHRPIVVFHAAAYKHVPLMECNPQAAVRNNVLGTRVVVDLADRFHVERFVMISTDKAVRPTNIMGATKLIAEEYLAAVAQRSRTRFITVRFGNVLNSAGSVVPTFRRQIEEGGPVTVTDPRMQRYFMTIPEAVQLVLQSGAIGEGGDVLILDMGEPVRIVELAKDMIRLSGQRYPEDIDIVFTGLRPGEKLYEELFYETEQHAVRVHEKIFRAPRGRLPAEGSSERDLALLKKHIYGSREELREVLWQITARIVEQSSGVEERTRRAA